MVHTAHFRYRLDHRHTGIKMVEQNVMLGSCRSAYLLVESCEQVSSFMMLHMEMVVMLYIDFLHSFNNMERGAFA